MKELTEAEFEDRTMALQRARKIFIESGLTNNITKAFEAYQAIVGEREREIFLDSHVHGRRPRTMMDRYERPTCPDCGSEMMFRIVPENKEGVKTQLICSSETCDLVLNSDKDIAWWMKNLKRKPDGSQGNVEGPEAGKQA